MGEVDPIGFIEGSIFGGNAAQLLNLKMPAERN